MSIRLSVWVSAWAIAFASCSGCSMWNQKTPSKSDDSWSISKLWKKEYQQPQSIAAIWAADVLTLPGKPPTRGFGGRIYFYNERSQAIPIDGELIVHGYLKQTERGQSERVAADKTFGFTAEQLTSHFSPSEMGASYSIWIPWDSADGFRQEITLIPTFKSKDGTIVQGSPAKVNLPGKALDGSEAPNSLMQTVAYTRTSIPTNSAQLASQEPAPTMRTTTINIPSNATIAKPRRVQALTLGGNGNSNSAPYSTPAATRPVNNPPAANPGVSLGGANANGSGPSIPAMTPPSTPLPDLPNLSPASSRGFSQTDMNQLSPSPMHQLSPAPMHQLSPTPMTDAQAMTRTKSLPPPSKWAPRSSFVQPASFAR